MSSSSMCQTVYDTVHTVVYDTVHTSVFDTVHTVSFDTVHSLVYDSASVTLQALRDSQTFYQDAFNNLLMLVSVAIAIASILLSFLSFVISKYDSKKLKTQFDVRSSEVAKEASAKIAVETKNEFAKAIEEQKKHLDEANKNSKKLWDETIPLVINSAKRTNDDAVAISDLCSIIRLLPGNLDEDQATLVMEEILPELDKRIRSLEPVKGFDNFVMDVQKLLNFFRPKLSPSMNKAKKNVIEKLIDEIVAIANSRLVEFSKIKDNGFSARTGRFYVAPRNKPDTKQRKK